jgi:hypothetical protein
MGPQKRKSYQIMKNQRFQKLLLVITAFTASVFFAQNLWAQDTSAGTSKPNVVPPPSASRPLPKLSYGVPQVLELTHAKIGDSTIIAYIRNSGIVYRLDASQIIYLKQQGVSEAVIAALINQRPRASATATVAGQPATTYAQSVPSSTAYVVPYTQSYYYYSPYYYPYYGYYGWPFASIFFSFGYGGGHWRGYHGGYHYRGGHHGAGFHGAGFHGAGFHGAGFHGGGGYHH